MGRDEEEKDSISPYLDSLEAGLKKLEAEKVYVHK